MFSADFLHRARAAWSWWSGELMTFVPAPMKKRLGLGTSSVVLGVEAEAPGYSVSRHSVDGHTDGRAQEFTGMEDAITELKRLRAEDDDIVLSFPPDKGLTVETRYPANVAAQLPTIVQFDVDKLTPFPADQVHIGHRVTGRVDQDILVEISVLPKSLTHEVVAQLHTAGLKVDRLVLADEMRMPPTNLLGTNLLDTDKSRAPRHRLLPWVLAGVGGVMAALLMLPALFAVLDTNRARADLMAHERDALRLLSLHRDVVSAQEARRNLLSVAGGETAALELVRDLTLLLPETAYLTRLSWQKDELVVSGYADNAAALIETFEEADWVGTTQFEGPIVADERRGLERFTLKIATRIKAS